MNKFILEGTKNVTFLLTKKAFLEYSERLNILKIIGLLLMEMEFKTVKMEIGYI